MQSLGIDLSTDPKKVWLCEIDWGEPVPRVVALDQATALRDPRASGVPEAERPWARDEAGLVAVLVERLAAFAPGPGRVAGLDAPFGWPVAFVDAVSNWEAGDLAGFRKRPDLRLRATDRFVQAASGVTPLSVSVDRIGSTAMLCAEVLSRYARRLDAPRLDRARALSGVAEVYPAAALRQWTGQDGVPLRSAGYKTGDAVREVLVRELTGLVHPIAEPVQLPGYGAAGVLIAPAFREALLESDDALDAFLCALVARSVALGRCHTVDRPAQPGELAPRASRDASPQDQAGRAERARLLQAEAAESADAEGWIHVPLAGPMREGLGLEAVSPPSALSVATTSEPPLPSDVAEPGGEPGSAGSGGMSLVA